MAVGFPRQLPLETFIPLLGLFKSWFALSQVQFCWFLLNFPLFLGKRLFDDLGRCGDAFIPLENAR